MQRKSKIVVSLASIAALALLAYIGLAYTNAKNDRAYCKFNLRNYNMCLASFGMCAEECEAVWKDPKKSEDFALQRYGVKIPKCPSGGAFKIVCNSRYYPISQLVCSLCDTHGHVDDEVLWQVEEIKLNRLKAEQGGVE